MYQRILSDPLQFPSDMPSEARSVMIGLLQRDPARRLGANGGEEIKRHPFFAKYVDWNRHVSHSSIICVSLMNHARLLHKKIQPPFKPSVVSNHSRFPLYYTKQNVHLGIRTRRG
jgi:serum/glucocorticoid-regulated kinase 2